MSYEWFISLRYLKAKRKQNFISLITFISIGGVAIGVSALIVVLAVMTGAQNDIRDKIVGSSPHIIITGAERLTIREANDIIADVKNLRGIKSATPFIYSQVILSSKERVSGVQIRGVMMGSGIDNNEFSKYMVAGTLDGLMHDQMIKSVETDEFGIVKTVLRAPIIIGRELAIQLGVNLGDNLTVISPVGKMTPLGSVPISKEFYIGGLFHAGMWEYDTGFALISISMAQNLFNIHGTVSGVEVKVDDVYETSGIAQTLRQKLNIEYIIRDWQQQNRNLFFALALEKTVIGLILILIIFVAAFNIISTLIMVTLEKTKDIVILKSMGASQRSIMKIFFYEGFTIGLIGTLLGVVGGMVLCELLDRYQFIKLPSDVYNLETLPVSMNLADIATVSLVAMVITVLAALYPAWNAGRVDPSESLRYE
jgi:lipoprotein-releasing system permease protein